MAKLTDSKQGTIANAQAPAEGKAFIYFYARAAPRGLGLKLTAAGGKTLVLKYQVDGRHRLKVIGDWPTWTLEAARDEGHEVLRGINRAPIRSRKSASSARNRQSPNWRRNGSTGTRLA